jgi:hypothetical protein
VATWNRNTSGNFQKDSSIISVFHGTDAFLLEDELNESQWTQIDNLAAANRKQFTNGFLDNFTIGTDGVSNQFYILNAAGNDQPLNILVDGYNLAVGRNSNTVFDGKLNINLNAPPSSGTRTDLVILEAWFEAMSYTDTLRKYGGTDAQLPTVTNSLLDSRVDKETSRRIQFRWRIRAIDGGTVAGLTSTKANLYNGTLSSVNYTQKGDIYVAETGQQTATVNGVTSVKTNGTVYAIPLFTVSRSAGVTSIAAANATDVSPKSRIKDGQARTEIINSTYSKIDSELIDTKVKNTLLIGENVALTDANNNFQSTTVANGLDEAVTAANTLADSKAKIMSQMIHSGILEGYGYFFNQVADNTAQAANDHRAGSNVFNYLQFPKQIININGTKITVGSSRNGNYADQNVVYLSEPPAFGTREDFVFVEAFWTLKNPGDPIYMYNGIGNKVVRNATTYEKVMEWRIRVVDGVDFNNSLTFEGFTYPTILPYNEGTVTQAQGGNSAPLNYPRGNLAADPVHSYSSFYNCSYRNTTIQTGKKIALKDFGLYVAGDGTQTSKNTLKTYDGYSYAVPLFRVIRRNSGGYRPSNLNGAANRVYSPASTTAVDINGNSVNGLFDFTAGLVVTVSFNSAHGFNVGDTIYRNTNNIIMGNVISVPSTTQIVIVMTNGGRTALTGQTFYKTSDRPDKLFANVIDAGDIIDMRHKVSTSGFNYQQMLEENFDRLLRGDLQTKDKLKLSKERFGWSLTPVPAGVVTRLMPVTVKGEDGVSRDLINLLGDIGGFEKDTNNDGIADGWTSYGTKKVVSISKTQFKYGSQSQYLQQNSDAEARVVYYNVTQSMLKDGSYYLFMLDAKVESNAINLDLRAMNQAGSSTLQYGVKSTTSSSWTPLYKAIQYNSANYDTGLMIHCGQNATGSGWIDGVRIYEIDKTTYDKIDVDVEFTGNKLAQKFPYVNSYPNVVENFLPDFNSGKWVSNGNTIVVNSLSTATITGAAATVSPANVTYTELGLIPNQTYIFTAAKNEGGIWIDSYDISNNKTVVTSALNTANTLYTTFTVPSNSRKITISLPSPLNTAKVFSELKIEQATNSANSTVYQFKYVPYGRWFTPYDYYNGDTSVRFDQYFGNGRLSLSNAQVSDTITEVIEPLKTPQKHIAITQATPGKWAVNDTIKITSADGFITGVIDSDTAIAKVITGFPVQTSPGTVTVDDVSRFSVGDTFLSYTQDFSSGGSYAYTVQAVDTVNKTITLSWSGGSSIDIKAGYVFVETTASSSVPVTTSTGLVGTWTGLGSKTATFTITTKPTTDTDNIKIQYSVLYPSGKGITQIPTDVSEIKVNGERSVKALDNIARIRANFNGKIAGSTDLIPHTVKSAELTNLQTPSSSGWTEFVNSTKGSFNSYNNLFVINDGYSSFRSSSANTHTAQHLFSFDIIRAITDKFGERVFADCITLDDKVAKAKSIVTKMSVYWTGYASNLITDNNITSNFVGKIVGSTIENPNIAKSAWGSTLTTPTNSTETGELVQGNYDNIVAVDGNTHGVITAANTAGKIGQNLFSFNVAEIVKRKYNLSFIPDQAWLKANVAYYEVNWYGKGTSSEGNKATLVFWNDVNKNWWINEGFTSLTTTSGTVTKLTLNRNNSIAQRGDYGFDANGFIHVLAYAGVADGMTVSTISTDSIDFKVNLVTGYNASTAYWSNGGTNANTWNGRPLAWGTDGQDWFTTSSSPRKLTSPIDMARVPIDANGMFYYLAYSDASNGVGTVNIYTDYIELEMELNVAETYYDVFTPENPFPKLTDNILTRNQAFPVDYNSTDFTPYSVTGNPVLSIDSVGVLKVVTDGVESEGVKTPFINVDWNLPIHSTVRVKGTGTAVLTIRGRDMNGIIISNQQFSSSTVTLTSDWQTLTVSNVFTSKDVVKIDLNVTIASGVNTFYITEWKLSQNTNKDEGLTWSPGRNRRFTSNLLGKTLGSERENPQRMALRWSATFPAPAIGVNYGIDNYQVEYDMVSKQGDGSMFFLRTQTSGPGTYPQAVFEFDLSHLGLSLTELKAALRKISPKWTGYGKGDSGIATPTVAPTVTTSANNNATFNGTYYVAYSWTNASGETLLSPETTVTVTTGNQLTVAPPAFPTGVAGFKIYIGTVSGQLKTTTNAPTNAATQDTWTAGAYTIAPPTVDTTGYGVIIKMWRDATQSWDVAYNGTTSSPATFNSNLQITTDRITSDQKIYMLVHSTFPASSLTEGQLYTDYVGIDFELADYIDYVTTVPVKIRKDTKEAKFVYPAQSYKYGNAGDLELTYLYLPNQDFFNGATISGNVLAVRDKAIFTTEYDVEGINKYNKKASYTNFMNRIPVNAVALGRMKKGTAITSSGRLVQILSEPTSDLVMYTTEAPVSISGGSYFEKFLTSKISIDGATGKAGGNQTILKFNTVSDIKAGTLYFLPVLAEINGEIYMIVISNTIYYDGLDNTSYDSKGSMFKLDGKPLIRLQ